MKRGNPVSNQPRILPRNAEAGFGLLKALLLVIFIGFIVAVVMDLMNIWIAIVGFIAAVVVLGVLANVSDIMRYMRISSM